MEKANQRKTPLFAKVTIDIEREIHSMVMGWKACM